jgi:hypothetical protein
MGSHQYDTCVSKAVRTVGLSSSRRPRPVTIHVDSLKQDEIYTYHDQDPLPNYTPSGFGSSVRLWIQIENITVCGGVQLTAIES